MPVDFLFLIPLTPKPYLSAERKGLQQLCFEQLKKLKASKLVWLLGEGDEVVSDFKSIPTLGATKEDKLFEIGQILEAKSEPVAKYIVRLDDDDLINPEVFDALANQTFDICYDAEHWFYEISSGLSGSQKRPWIANTAIHAYASAMTKIAAKGGSILAGEKNYLFACDHSLAWQPYYARRKSVKTAGHNPLYLRILSPGSITAKVQNSEDLNHYSTYLTTFGNWDKKFPLEANIKPLLTDLWIGEHGHLEERTFPKKSVVKRILNKLKQ